jgi:hypothetical protein
MDGAGTLIIVVGMIGAGGGKDCDNHHTKGLKKSARFMPC